jgi:hypothetical protein
MQLRSNIGLKLFALILFSLEVMTPTLIVGPVTVGADQMKTWIDASQFHNPLFSAFIEELCENEEDKESDKAISWPKVSLLFGFGQNPIGSKHSKLTPFTSSQPFNTTPPIFLTQHKFLI